MIANNRKVGFHCCITCSKLIFKCFKWRCEKKYKHESIRKCMNIKVTKYYVTGGTCSVQPSQEKWLCIRSEGRKLALLLRSLSLFVALPVLPWVQTIGTQSEYKLYSQFVILLAQACFLQSLCHSIFHIGITVLN